ncbi:MAG: hypothetical protein L6R42_001740 [Xanthoria sp. 1 TBL-2021]|nr:MAG: hypothetical protein L6R42_001740 [Xanthoria sp. 1 TBL-2021]
MHLRPTIAIAFLLTLASSILCLPKANLAMAKRASSHPMVFAHYMLIMQPKNGDYTEDINLAKEAGIDAFAVNYGGWNVDWTQHEAQLEKFYRTAEQLDFSLFLSIDTTSVKDKDMIIKLSNTYASSSAQLKVDGSIVLSSFQTDPPAWDWKTDVLDKINGPVLLLPGTLSDDATALFSNNIPGAGPFTWIHPYATAEQEHSTDVALATQRDRTGKLWMAGIAPWFFTHLSLDKNWAQAQDDKIFVDRWSSLLTLQPDFIEIVTWNDWSESSYIGPPDSSAPGTTDAYWGSADHSAFRSISKVFIKAFKAGQDSVTVDAADEGVYMFYRRQPARSAGTSDSLPLPSDAGYLKNEIFVVSLLSAPTEVTLVSGDAAPVLWTAPAGLQKTGHPWSFGAQVLQARRGGQVVADKVGAAVVAQMDKYDGNVVAL